MTIDKGIPIGGGLYLCKPQLGPPKNFSFCADGIAWQWIWHQCSSLANLRFIEHTPNRCLWLCGTRRYAYEYCHTYSERVTYQWSRRTCTSYEHPLFTLSKHTSSQGCITSIQMGTVWWWATSDKVWQHRVRNIAISINSMWTPKICWHSNFFCHQNQGFTK